MTGGGTFTCDPTTAPVGGGIEFGIGPSAANPFLTANFGAAGVAIRATQAGSLGSTILNFTDLTTPFTSFTLNSQTGFGGYNAANTTLTNGVFTIDLRGTSFAQGDLLTFALGASSGVPEPATWAMMMLGFGGMGYAMRRKAKVSTRIRFA